MSRTSRATGSSSPIKRYVDFKPGPGVFRYYDKEASKNVDIPSMDIIILDVLASVTGWYEGDSGGTQISSNMVKNISNDVLTVRANKNKNFSKPITLHEGIYDKAAIKMFDGKYTTNIICLADFDDGEGRVMTRIQLSGYSVKTWTDYVSDNPYEAYLEHEINMVKGKQQKKGSTKFHGLVFKNNELSAELGEIADKADAEFQEYFEGSPISESLTETSTEQSDNPPLVVEDEDDIPF